MTLFPGSFLENLFLIIHNRPYTDNRLIHFDSHKFGRKFFSSSKGKIDRGKA